MRKPLCSCRMVRSEVKKESGAPCELSCICQSMDRAVWPPPPPPPCKSVIDLVSVARCLHWFRVRDGMPCANCAWKVAHVFQSFCSHYFCESMTERFWLRYPHGSSVNSVWSGFYIGDARQSVFDVMRADERNGLYHFLTSFGSMLKLTRTLQVWRRRQRFRRRLCLCENPSTQYWTHGPAPSHPRPSPPPDPGLVLTCRRRCRRRPLLWRPSPRHRRGRLRWRPTLVPLFQRKYES